MHKRIILIIAVLGVFLSAATQAQAISQPTFTVNPQPGYVGEPITLTDTSGSSGLHEWDCDYSGNPAEFNAEQTGSSATCVYTQETGTFVAQRVTDGSQSMLFETGITVYAQSEKPFDTILASPSTIALPDTVVLKSTKSQLDVYCESAGEQCPAYVTGHTGPDGSGLYTYSVQVDNAKPGAPLTLDTEAYNPPNGPRDHKVFTLTVSANANAPFHLLKRTLFVCQGQERHGRPTGKLAVGGTVRYYQSGGPDPTKVTVKLQRKAKKPAKSGKAKWLMAGKEVGLPDPMPWSDYLYKDTSGLVTIPPAKIAKQKYRVVTKISAGKYLPPKKKVTNLKPSKCS